MEEKLKLNAAQEKFFKNIVEHLDRSPEEVKRALNINRQQRKQYLKEQEKKLRAVKNLTPIQISIMKEVVDKEKEKSQNTVAEYTMSLYSSVNSVLYSDFNFNGDESVKLWEKVENILDEDKAARKELSKISQEEWRRMEQQVNEFIKKELEQGKKQKEIIEELKKKFPKLSTAMRVNAVKEVKEGWKEENKLIVEERQAKADEEVKAINRDEAKNIATSWKPCEEEADLKVDTKEFEKQMERVGQVANDIKGSVICQDNVGVTFTVKGIVEQLREQQEFRKQKVEKANKELEELEKLIAAKKEEINKTEEEIGRIEEAAAILEPVNI
ncbi:hypothetical protein KLF44_16200 (plasmid) [Clostridium perfringens]|uniref:hypothetical protein n=1 Tax=Clostridium perfringens TaxID=1502 RepID=UPI001CCD156E|nr:hypothetical protein [Clostridium perfringens]UBK39483.1 hypothetical protein KLF44_16200 [Clostridium perfringens]